MKKLILAAALITATSGAALAQSSALDFQEIKPNTSPIFSSSNLDFTPTASIEPGSKGVVREIEVRDRLGDGSPRHRRVDGRQQVNLLDFLFGR